MAYESGYTHLDGKPCKPILASYIGIVILSMCVGELIGIAIFGTVNLILDYKEIILTVQESNSMFIILATTIGIIISTIFVYIEKLSRKEVIKAYKHKLDIYNRRRNMMIDNGMKLKSDSELYHELFSG